MGTLRSVFGETKILFAKCYYCFGLWFLKNQIYHFYHYWHSFLPYCWSFWYYIWPDRPFKFIVTDSFHNFGNWILYTSDIVKLHPIKLYKHIFKSNIAFHMQEMAYNDIDRSKNCISNRSRSDHDSSPWPQTINNWINIVRLNKYTTMSCFLINRQRCAVLIPHTCDGLLVV